MFDLAFILEYLTAFRFVLFLCCCGYAVIIYHWLRPTALQFKAGIMAAVMQFWMGLILNFALVEWGFWQYRSMNFMVWGIPIDLHINWSILWGPTICWLSDKWPKTKITSLPFLTYILIWSLLTLCFDIMMADWMIFLESYVPSWWIADILILTFIFGFTVWFYKSIANYNLCFLPPISPYIRSLLYLSFFMALFFIYVPEQIFVLMHYFQIPMQVKTFPQVACVLFFISIAIGGWATYEFARKGQGTPIPIDDPQFLVTSGPYLFMSNPMQISGILLTMGVFFLNFHWIYLIYLIDVVLVVWLIFEHFESLHLCEMYGERFREFQKSVPLWRIQFVPPKLHENFRPTLFIDQECSVCVGLSKFIKDWDFSNNIQIQSLQSLFQKETHQPEHAHLQALAGSKTTLILAEPRWHKNRWNKKSCKEFLYSTKGRAILRLFGYAPLPICFIAALEGLPFIPQISDGLYVLFVKIKNT